MPALVLNSYPVTVPHPTPQPPNKNHDMVQESGTDEWVAEMI